MIAALGSAVLFLCLAGPTASGEAGVRARAAGGIVTLENGILAVRYSRETGTFSARRGSRVFLTEGRLGGARDAAGREARIVETRGALGRGKAIVVRFAADRIGTLGLYEDRPFLCARVSLRHEGSGSVAADRVTTLTAVADAGAEAGELRALGPDGPAPIGPMRRAYAFLAAAHPATRAGLVWGYLTHHRGSGVVGVEARGGALAIEGRAEYGRLLLPSGGKEEGETLAVGWFEDALDGLEAFAGACARANAVELPPRIPSGYCTWYHARALDERRAATLAAFCAEKLRDHGLGCIQIDDGWQVGRRDFTAHNPRGPYPSGMARTARAIASRGLTAGLWLTPFGWDPKAPALADHPDRFVKRPDGSIASVRWAGSCLDMTHPGARAFLAEVVRRMTREWGFGYLKIDGLWAGTAARILYPAPQYRDDALGDARFHDPAATPIEAYRRGLRLVREAAGDGVFLLGCNIAQNMRTLGASMGLVDGMRIGPDIGTRWGPILRSVRCASALYFLHGRVWYNDPDCLLVRPPLTLEEARAWASLIALSGGLVIVSEWLPGLPAERLEIVKRVIPNPGTCGRPLDLFAAGLPRIWHVRVERSGVRWDVVGLFNWEGEGDVEIEVPLEELGLAAGRTERYAGVSFWDGTFVGPFAGRLRARVPRHGCRVIALRRLADRPVLAGTSRHVVQGAVDPVALAWDETASALRGASVVPAGDPLELRIAIPPTGWGHAEAEVSAEDREAGVRATLRREEGGVRVTVESPRTRRVSWSVAFRRRAGDADGAPPGEPLRQEALFVSGTEGYHTFRIPALLSTKEGTVLAFCEGRKHSRAAVSVATNIAEGASRRSERDCIRFLEVAYGSACEVNSLIDLANRLGLFSDEEAARLKDEADHLCRAIYALIDTMESRG